jgi:predicted ATPase with chaperone activity
MFNILGPAISSGRGMFLYGHPGNGKTSIAERVTAAFQSCIWIPHAIFADGQIVKLYDPETHVRVDGRGLRSIKLCDQEDPRWIQIRRPTVISGGELTMDALEIEYNPETKISEAPLQLKSNGGTLVIDDFGRQRMPVDELLNRWIVPLEKRHDYLSLATGKKIKVPFDQLIIFSTNLEPRDLVDEAFLRRIPYKINIGDPTEEEFRTLFEMFAARLHFDYRPEVVDYVIEKVYRAGNRPFRCCHPRDLLLQVRNMCLYHGTEPEMKPEYFDQAAFIYFSVM